jgi:pimeloyl-ACP methyl ester carboxylesterase
MAMPVTRYAKSGDVHVAYQVFGSGPIDLVFIPGFVSHIENYWEQPDLARWLLRLSRFARIAIFDKRGTGLSDRMSEIPSLDQRMDDARAVMDAARIERAVLLGVSEGGPLAALFAATYPRRCKALVLYGSFACRCGHHHVRTTRPCSNGGDDSNDLARAPRLPWRSCG